MFRITIGIDTVGIAMAPSPIMNGLPAPCLWAVPWPRQCDCCACKNYGVVSVLAIAVGVPIEYRQSTENVSVLNSILE